MRPGTLRVHEVDKINVNCFKKLMVVQYLK